MKKVKKINKVEGDFKNGDEYHFYDAINFPAPKDIEFEAVTNLTWTIALPATIAACVGYILGLNYLPIPIVSAAVAGIFFALFLIHYLERLYKAMSWNIVRYKAGVVYIGKVDYSFDDMWDMKPGLMRGVLRIWGVKRTPEEIILKLQPAKAKYLLDLFRSYKYQKSKEAVALSR